MGSEGAQPEIEESDQSKKKYVGVVFVHGIGQQRNYESTSLLIEAIDDWVYDRYREEDPQAGPRLSVKTRRERLVGSTENAAIPYVQADHDKSQVRFYEIYWAPAAAYGTTALGSFLWLMRQIQQPLKVLAAPWGSYMRLRRGDLVRLGSRRSVPSKENSEGESRLGKHISALSSIYLAFVSQRGKGRRTYRRFRAFLSEREKGRDNLEELKALCRSWRRFHRWTQIVNLMLLVGVGVTVVATLLLLVIISWKMLAWAAGNPTLSSLLPGDSLRPGIGNVLGLLAIILSAIGLRGFFRDYVGDIRQFVTYEETQPLHERRRKILDVAECTLRHVLNDERCTRVVVVSHSLGTTIAFDAMLRLRAFNQADNPDADDGTHMIKPLPLNKLQYFITFGSPIDKVNYFFAALRSSTRSYEELVEWLRGDITCVPFSKSGQQPHIHWINFWDRGDPVSGPIETVTGATIRKQRVDNVQVATCVWPDPGASHGEYFRNPEVIGTIYRAAFLDKLSFANPPKTDNERTILQFLGPGRSSHLQSVLLVVPLVVLSVLVWTVMALVATSFGAPPVATLGVCIAVLALGAWIQRRIRRGMIYRKDPIGSGAH